MALIFEDVFTMMISNRSSSIRRRRKTMLNQSNPA